MVPCSVWIPGIFLSAKIQTIKMHGRLDQRASSRALALSPPDDFSRDRSWYQFSPIRPHEVRINEEKRLGRTGPRCSLLPHWLRLDLDLLRFVEVEVGGRVCEEVKRSVVVFFHLAARCVWLHRASIATTLAPYVTEKLRRGVLPASLRPHCCCATTVVRVVSQLVIEGTFLSHSGRTGSSPR